MKSLFLAVVVLAVCVFAHADEVTFYQFKTPYARFDPKVNSTVEFKIHVHRTSAMDPRVDSQDSYTCKVGPADRDHYFCLINRQIVMLDTSLASAKTILKKFYHVSPEDLNSGTVRDGTTFQFHLKNDTIYHVIIRGRSTWPFTDTSMKCQIAVIDDGVRAHELSANVKCQSELNSSKRVEVRGLVVDRSSYEYSYVNSSSWEGEPAMLFTGPDDKLDALIMGMAALKGVGSGRFGGCSLRLGLEESMGESWKLTFGMRQERHGKCGSTDNFFKAENPMKVIHRKALKAERTGD